MQSVDRHEIEFKVACDVMESVKLGKICGFYDATANFELHFRAIGWSRQGCSFDIFFFIS